MSAPLTQGPACGDRLADTLQGLSGLESTIAELSAAGEAVRAAKANDFTSRHNVITATQGSLGHLPPQGRRECTHVTLNSSETHQ